MLLKFTYTIGTKMTKRKHDEDVECKQASEIMKNHDREPDIFRHSFSTVCSTLSLSRSLFFHF